ncbi:uncharacterized protein [Triticum aestivum]|uniref:uncharacterized protein n=1 Tax=Triticum aestivum TaxID=4565 RepID=UPI001D00DAFC|nr:uncharacterized protein LOC123071690 [Triticum aestivum]
MRRESWRAAGAEPAPAPKWKGNRRRRGLHRVLTRRPVRPTQSADTYAPSPPKLARILSPSPSPTPPRQALLPADPDRSGSDHQPSANSGDKLSHRDRRFRGCCHQSAVGYWRQAVFKQDNYEQEET